MTEAEWLACDDPQAMLEFLGGRVSERKLRLFACACCRHAWAEVPHLLVAYDDEVEAVEVAERFADGVASQHELRRIFAQLESDCDTRDSPARFAVDDRIAQEVKSCADFAIYSVEDDGVDPSVEREKQASLLRCICGNPVRLVSTDPTWTRWNGGAAFKVAQTIYAARSFEQLPILADALEDAGCTNRDILDHCRQPGEHVRGCWVVDLMLGKS